MWLIQEQALLFAEESDMLSAGRGFWIWIDGREMITWISLSVSVIAVTSFVCSPLGYVLNLILYLFLDLFLSVFIGWFLGWFLSLFLGTNAFSLIGFISWCWARGFLLLLCHRGLSSFRLVHYGAQLVRYHKCGRMILPSVRQSLLCREEIYILLEVKRRNELLNYLCKSSCSETFTPSTADEAANRSFLFFFWTSLLWSSLIFFTFLGDIVMLFPLGSSLAGSFHSRRTGSGNRNLLFILVFLVRLFQLHYWTLTLFLSTWTGPCSRQVRQVLPRGRLYPWLSQMHTVSLSISFSIATTCGPHSYRYSVWREYCFIID